ncbi:Cytochrome P450, partial [Corchorus capsularis]
MIFNKTREAFIVKEKGKRVAESLALALEQRMKKQKDRLELRSETEPEAPRRSTATVETRGYLLRTGGHSGKKLPPGSLGFPLIGESISFIKAHKHNKTVDWIQDHVNKYGPVFKSSLMGSNAVLLIGQAGNRFIFSGKDNGIASNQVGTAAGILGKHSIFELPGPRHKIVRGAIMSFLKPEAIQRIVSAMDSLVQQELFQVGCSLLFRLPESKEKDELFEDFIVAIKGLWALPLKFPGTAYHKALQARGRICRLLSKLIKERKKEIEARSIGLEDNINDLISSLLMLRNENDEPLLEEEIIDNFIAVMIASHDTTSVFLSYFMIQLTRDTEVFEKVLQEQKEVAKAIEGKDGKFMTWSEIQMMKHTWRVGQELLRLNPPVFGNFKCAKRDINFDGYDIPKGWKVFWFAAGTHMDEKIFNDPDKFDPGRFEVSSKLLPPYTYIPFGAGPRICPGAEYAKIEALLIIHHLIMNYQWTAMIPDEPILRDPMAYPAMGLPVKLQKRSFHHAND